MDRKASGGDWFSKMDKDGSGGISREEFAQATTCCLRFCFVERPCMARLNSAGSKNGNGIFRKHGQSICQHAGNLSQASLVFVKRVISIVFGCFWLIIAEGRPGCSSFPYSLKTGDCGDCIFTSDSFSTALLFARSPHPDHHRV